MLKVFRALRTLWKNLKAPGRQAGPGLIIMLKVRKPQAEALSNKTRKGKGFQRENRRDPTLSFPLVSKAKIDIARDRRSGSRVDS